MEGWIAGATSLAVVAMAFPVIQALAVRFRLYDLPGRLKLHIEPIPRVGGVLMALALLASLFISRIAISHSSVSFLVALGTLWAISLGDDLRGLSPGVRLVAHLGTGFLLWQAGWSVPLLRPAILSSAATCIFVAFFVSAFNMLDGADGIASGTTAVIALGYATLLGGSTSSLGSTVAWSLLGTCLGFLPFNFPPAKMFMGDSGSTVLGFIVAFLSLDFYRAHSGYGGYLLVPLFFALLPLLDAVFAIVRRLRNGSSPFEGDRRHFYDVLLLSGWPTRRVAYCSYVATSVVVLLGWLCDREVFVAALIVAALVSALLAAVRLRMFRSAILVNNVRAVIEGSEEG